MPRHSLISKKLKSGSGARASLSSRQNNLIREIESEISRAKSILITAHKDPDPDAIGSTLGLWHILKNRFPKKTLWVYNATPFASARFSALPGAAKILSSLPSSRFDIVIALDAGNLARLALNDYIARYQPAVIYIDHHQVANIDAKIAWIEPETESASQMVYALAKGAGWKINVQAATALMIGIAGDTGHFIRASANTFRIAADLMELRPNVQPAYHQMFSWQSLAAMKLFGAVLLRAKFMRDKRFIWSYVSREDIARYGIKAGDLGNYSNFLRDYKEAEVALFLRPRATERRTSPKIDLSRELPGAGKIWEGSLRSVSKHPLNLAKLAARFGGGGHFHAAGFETKLSRDTIVKMIAKALPKSR